MKFGSDCSNANEKYRFHQLADIPKSKIYLNYS